MKVFIGLGANLGERAAAIREALDLLEARGLGRVVRASSLYRTEPVGFRDQPWFINAAAQIETGMDPADFFFGLQEIEREMGRPQPRVAQGPRLIDLDLLLWEEAVISSPDLKVPHPRMHLRRFVLVPLAEIAPLARHPSLKLTITDLLESLADTSVVEKLDRDNPP